MQCLILGFILRTQRESRELPRYFTRDEGYNFLGIPVATRRRLAIDEAGILADERLRQFSMIYSPTQLRTEGDGNCFFHGLFDQIQ